MSFIGSLDQFDLSIILQRIESYKKTGLLKVKQEERIVELSFRQGQLMCIGPVRPDISLADRLLQAGVISREAYQEAIQVLGADRYREVGTALTLIDLGYVNQHSLYRWALSEARRVIEALIAWTDGEIYFEENQQPPSSSLLIALPVTSLLSPQRSEATPQYDIRNASNVKIRSQRSLRVFLCHSSNDKPIVRKLYQRLRTEGIAPWLDEEDLLPGQNWQHEIRKAVRRCDVVIVCLSQSSVTKIGYVQKEIGFALDVADQQPEGTIFLIPLKLEECRIPERLNHLHWVNYFDDHGFNRLMRALELRAMSLRDVLPIGNKPNPKY